jgi:hypothetical protein
MFLGWRKLMTSGSHDYYAHRAETSQVTIYASRPNDALWKSFFLLDDTKALESLRKGLVDCSSSQLDSRALVFDTLLDQVIKDGCLFLSRLAREVHKAVSSHSRQPLELRHVT